MCSCSCEIGESEAPTNFVEDLENRCGDVGNPHRQDWYRLTDVRVADNKRLLVDCNHRQNGDSYNDSPKAQEDIQKVRTVDNSRKQSPGQSNTTVDLLKIYLPCACRQHNITA